MRKLQAFLNGWFSGIDGVLASFNAGLLAYDLFRALGYGQPITSEGGFQFGVAVHLIAVLLFGHWAVRRGMTEVHKLRRSDDGDRQA